MADATQDTAAVQDWMLETYTKKEFFDPYQEHYTPVLSDIEECPDEPAKGRKWNIPLYMATAWNVRMGAEGGPQAEVESDSVVQGFVKPTDFKGTVKITETLDKVGTADAHFNGGALDHQMKQRTMEMAKLMQIAFWGHGGGGTNGGPSTNASLLAIVDDNVTANTTIKTRLPWAWFRLRKNQRIEFRRAGVQIGAAVKITKIDQGTKGITGGGVQNTFAGIITVDANVTIQAGDEIHPKGDYGTGPNGIVGLITDGSVQPNFMGRDRAVTFPDLNAQRLHANGVVRPVAEDLMREMADRVYFAGREIDSIRCNAGVISAVAALSTNIRRYNVVKGDWPKYIQGHREGDLLFAYDKVTTTFKKDPQCPARYMYFLSFKDSFYKHTSAPLGFLRRGGDILQPVVSAGGTGYDYALQARLWALCNLSNYFSPGNGVIEDLKDKSLAGDQ